MIKCAPAGGWPGLSPLLAGVLQRGLQAPAPHTAGVRAREEAATAQVWIDSRYLVVDSRQQ